MKYLPLILSLSLIACAQPNNQVAQEEVEQEKVQEQLIVPFDPSTATHVKFSDARAFFGHPRELLPWIDEKDQFETTEQFDARVARQSMFAMDWDASHSYLLKSRLFAPITYDADRQVFTPRGSIPCHDKWPGDFWNCLVIPFIPESKSNRPPTRVFGEWLNLVITPERVQRFEGDAWMKRFPNTCPVPLEQAKEVAPFIRLAYVYKFEEAVMRRGHRVEEPSVRDSNKTYFYENLGIHGDITHLVCYHEQTGEILYQREI